MLSRVTRHFHLFIFFVCHQERRGVFDWSVLQFKEAVDFII